jgi:predicted nucleic-acid-binding Zn-ribbon protein
MKRNCKDCEIEMKEAFINPGLGMFVLQHDFKSKLFDKLSKINTLVCPNCGYIEFKAEKPELFK